jgi:hypothetical protein
MELRIAYETGKFGDWLHPGKRLYIKENIAEHRNLSPTDLEDMRKVVGSNRLLFAL